MKGALLIFFMTLLMLSRAVSYGQNLATNTLQIAVVNHLFTDNKDETFQAKLAGSGEYQVAGKIAFYHNDYMPAVYYFNRTLAQEDNLLDRYFLGMSYYELGQTEFALAQWQLAGPKPIARSLALEAGLANRQDDSATAIEYAKLALMLDSSLGEAYLELGRGQAACGEWDAALINYEKATQLIADRYRLSSLYRSMGALYSQVGDRETAVRVLEIAVSETPDVYLGYLQLASAYWDMGRTDDAIATLETAISLEPKNVQAYLNMGDLYRDRDLLEEALRWYQEAKQIDPNSGRADYAIGTLLLRISQPDESIRYLEKAVALGWQPYWVLFDLGSAYEQTGQHDAAAVTYRQVTQMTDIPETTLLSAWLNLAQLYTNMAEESQANEAWLRVLALEPQHPAIPQFIRAEQ